MSHLGHRSEAPPSRKSVLMVIILRPRCIFQRKTNKAANGKLLPIFDGKVANCSIYVLVHMLVWRRSLGRSHRYKMFSVVVSWTNNKDPTSDKGIWLFGTEWEAQCSERACPSLAEPFSTLGTDIKAAPTPLKYSNIHRHKEMDAHTRTCMPAHTSPAITYTMQEACLSRTRKEGRQQKQLSVDRNKKNKS